MLRQLFKSSIFQFIIVKYLGYGIQFLNALLIARYLGLFYFGIYGFTNLALQYLSYTNIGVQYSFNVLISTDNTINKIKTENYLSNSIMISLLIGFSILIILIIIRYFGLLDFLDKYLFTKYYILVMVTAIVQFLINIYISFFRIRNKFQLINLSTILPGVLMLICLAFFKEEDLFWALLITLLTSQLLILGLFIYSSNIRIKFTLDKSVCKTLISRGVFLLAYNLSFYLIILVARTVVSYFYKVEEFALFNFANSLSIAITMLIGSFGFLIFPKMLNKFSTMDGPDRIAFMQKTRTIYLFGTFFIIFSSIAFLPLIFLFLPDYKSALNCIIALLISQLLLENSFGYSTLLIQEGREKTLTIYGYIAVVIVFIVGIINKKLLNLDFDYISIAVICGVMVYSHLVISLGNTITKQFSRTSSLLLYIYNYKYFIPLFSFVVLFFLSRFYFLNIFIVLLVFLVLNIKELKTVLTQIKEILLNKSILQIEGIDK
jgi:O-antigen/teichoic acid export membrane protein